MNRKSGSSLVELGAGAMVLIPIMLYGMDFATMYMGQSFNVNVCRDAARAAASGPPTMCCPGGSGDPLRPRMRAKMVIDRSSDPRAMIRVDPTFKFYEQINDPIPTRQFGGPINGWVKVETTANVFPPFTLPGVQKVIQLKTQKEFPYTFTVQPDFNTGGGGGPKPPYAKTVDTDS